ncbi:MAG TPA: HAD-IA family hydrolase, partial [Saprospiraceae bacterium]|nr:HAD-IA family hydrolase [Saprospiraceae bacterium]
GAVARTQALFKPGNDPEFFKSAMIKYETGAISTEIFINALLSQCPHTIQALDIIQVWNSMLIGIPGHRLELLLALRKSYSVYLLSNTCALHLDWTHRYMKATYGVHDFEQTYFNGAYYSHLLQNRKPDEAYFRKVINHASIRPAESLFMDDIAANIETASRMGFQTHLVEPGDEIGEYLTERGMI